MTLEPKEDVSAKHLIQAYKTGNEKAKAVIELGKHTTQSRAKL